MQTTSRIASIRSTALALPALLAFSAVALPARAQAPPLVVEGLTGAITPGEIGAFKAHMLQQTVPPHSYGTGTEHNALADGPAGRGVEAMGMMVEATGDIEILDRMIFFVDGFIGLRNDMPNGEHVTMWTGNVDKVWIPNPPSRPPQNYAGGENGDTTAHIEYCALLIARNPSIWNMTVPDGDPHGYGATYLQRARTYIASADEANDEYSAKYFVVPGTNLIRNPPNWPAGFHTMEAINIQMMLDGAFQRNAEVHEALGDAPARVAQYDAIVRASARECLDGMKHSYSKGGHMPYAWGYYPWDTSFTESVGHGAYDVLGIWRASTRAAYGLLPGELAPIGDALVYGISLGGDAFAALVDGTGGSTTWLTGEWIVTADWNRAAYELIASADIASGRQANDPHMTAAILWMKQRLASPPDAGASGVPDASVPTPPSDGGTSSAPGDAAASQDSPAPSGSQQAGGCACAAARGDGSDGHAGLLVAAAFLGGACARRPRARAAGYRPARVRAGWSSIGASSGPPRSASKLIGTSLGSPSSASSLIGASFGSPGSASSLIGPCFSSASSAASLIGACFGSPGSASSLIGASFGSIVSASSSMGASFGSISSDSYLNGASFGSFRSTSCSKGADAGLEKADCCLARAVCCSRDAGLRGQEAALFLENAFLES